MKTAFLLALLTGLVLLIGSFWGYHGLIIAGVFALVMNVFSYWFSDKVVLAMYGAKEVSRQQAPRLHAIVENLVARSGLPMPKVCIVPSQAPNAFATGRNPRHAVVAVTEGCLRLLNERELEGVLAHELAHVGNRDMLIGTVAAVMAGTIMFIATMARWGAMFGGFGGGGRGNNRGGGGNLIALLAIAIFAPLAAMLIRLAISRSREYQADVRGARFAGSPDGLADALERLQSASQRVTIDAGPATAHMFIVNPLKGKDLMALFSTHPPIDERVRRLRRMQM
ncbi:MAG TPA: zinc metalloprotease HtpX [Planctomycetota bacterium]|nr:zinc metalloprotease HtpX [Planctomycetota bacterium]